VLGFTRTGKPKRRDPRVRSQDQSTLNSTTSVLGSGKKTTIRLLDIIIIIINFFNELKKQLKNYIFVDGFDNSTLKFNITC
jgi:hypothetical protein